MSSPAELSLPVTAIQPEGSPTASQQRVVALLDARAAAAPLRTAAEIAIVSSALQIFILGGNALRLIADGRAPQAAIIFTLVAAAFCLNSCLASLAMWNLWRYAAVWLGLHHLILALTTGAVGISMMVSISNNIAAVLAAFPPGDPEFDRLRPELSDPGPLIMIGGVLLLTLLTLGLLSLYFFSRARLHRKWLAETPSWAVDSLR